MENQSYTLTKTGNTGKESKDSMSSHKSNDDDDDTDTLKLADEQEALPLAALDVYKHL